MGVIFNVKTRLMHYIYIYIYIYMCVCVNTTILTLLHSHMFQPSRGQPQGVLIHYASTVNKMRVQM